MGCEELKRMHRMRMNLMFGSGDEFDRHAIYAIKQAMLGKPVVKKEKKWTAEQTSVAEEDDIPCPVESKYEGLLSVEHAHNKLATDRHRAKRHQSKRSLQLMKSARAQANARMASKRERILVSKERRFL